MLIALLSLERQHEQSGSELLEASSVTLRVLPVCVLHLPGHHGQELGEVDGSVAIGINLIDHVLKLSLSWVLTQRSHNLAENVYIRNGDLVFVTKKIGYKLIKPVACALTDLQSERSTRAESIVKFWQHSLEKADTVERHQQYFPQIG